VKKLSSEHHAAHADKETATMNLQRREALKKSATVAGLLMAAGYSPLARAQGAPFNRAAFEAKNLADVVKALGAGAPVESKDITLNAPDIAENGAVVPLGAATTIAGAKRVLLLVEKNPNALAGAFEVSDSVDANFGTRVKMGQTSNVYAVVLTADNKAFFAQKEVKVTLGGCGG
jgi:sulfur-oxidizing protein SoxY